MVAVGDNEIPQCKGFAFYIGGERTKFPAC